MWGDAFLFAQEVANKEMHSLNGLILYESPTENVCDRENLSFPADAVNRSQKGFTSKDSWKISSL